MWTERQLGAGSHQFSYLGIEDLRVATYLVRATASTRVTLAVRANDRYRSVVNHA